MTANSLKIACVLAILVTPAAAQQRDRCDEDRFMLTAEECTAYGGIVDEVAGQCQLSDADRELAREELCLGLPAGGGAVTNFAPIAAPLLGVVALAGLAGGGGSTTSTTSTTGTN